jgi:hypothetical protein
LSCIERLKSSRRRSSASILEVASLCASISRSCCSRNRAIISPVPSTWLRSVSASLRICWNGLSTSRKRSSWSRSVSAASSLPPIESNTDVMRSTSDTAVAICGLRGLLTLRHALRALIQRLQLGRRALDGLDALVDLVEPRRHGVDALRRLRHRRREILQPFGRALHLLHHRLVAAALLLDLLEDRTHLLGQLPILGGLAE